MFNNIFLSSEFRKNILTVLSGTVFAQALPVLTAPLFSRIYRPEEFGIFALFTAIAGLIASIGTGAYDQAIMLPKEDFHSMTIVALVTFIGFGVSCLTLILTLIFKGLFVSLLHNTEIGSWLYVIPLTVMLTVLSQAFIFWHNRIKNYKILTLSKIMQALVTVSVGLSLGFFKFRASGLILANILGQITLIAILVFQIRTTINSIPWIFSLNSIIEQAKRYCNFPKYTLLQSFVDGLRENGVVFLISRFFSTKEIGYYTYSFKVIRAPLGFIGSSVSQVYYEKAASTINNNENIWPVTKRTIIHLSILAIPVIIVILCFGPNLFSFVFGNNWRESGIFSQITLFWVVVNFVASPVSTIPQIFERQKSFMIISIIFSIIVIGIFYMVSSLSHNMKISLASISVVYGFYGIAFLFWVSKLCKRQSYNVN